MKIIITQQNYEVGAFQTNFNKISEAIEQARLAEAQMIVFSELSICGYPPHDYLLLDDFITRSEQFVQQLLPLSKDIIIIVGAPERNPAAGEKALFNAAFVLSNGKIVHTVRKQHLSDLGVFKECRYFEPGKVNAPVELEGKRVFITIGRDLWQEYCGFAPAENENTLLQEPADLIVNLSCIPFDYTMAGCKKLSLKEIAHKYKTPVITSNPTGSQTEVIFKGNSIAVDSAGNLCCEMPQFEEGMEEIILQAGGSFNRPTIEPFALSGDVLMKPKDFIPDLNISLIYKALVLGIRDYFKKNGFTRAILGSSGGLDSAITLAIACDALGSENVMAVLMPSIYSTDHSVSDAEQLSKNLNNPYEVIPIKDIYEQFLTSLKPQFKDLPFNVTEENIQARTRGLLLMAMANKFGYILLNTSNKSELAVGYGTLYGDLAGGISVLGDCYKLQVFELAKYINLHHEIIPDHIITKPPSAELRPDQKDSDSLPQYDMLDPILYQYIDRLESPENIIEQGYDESTVNRIITMVHRNEYKRHQFCPILSVSGKTYGAGRPMPVVSNYSVG